MSSSSPSSLSATDGIAAVDHTAVLISSPAASVTAAKQPSSRLRHYTERAAFIGMAAGSVFLALFSYRYLVPSARVTLAPNVLNNFFARPFLYVHAAAAATALLVGPFQFVASLRRSHLRLHRMLGRLYVMSCLVGGTSALPLSLASTSGPAAQSGFFVLGVLWLAITGNAWRLAVMGRIAEHKRWMVRSFALTFAAVSLRVIIFGLPLFGVPFVTAYGFGAWASWVANLLVVEAWMWYTSRAVADVRVAPQTQIVSTGDDKVESLIALNEGL